MNCCDDCHAKGECLIHLDNWAGCVRFNEVEYKNDEIIFELYRIIWEKFPENDYDVIIEAKSLLLKDSIS
jgi:hypothetical protein